MIYNVLVGVVANIEADTPLAAQTKLVNALDRAGFQPYDLATLEVDEVFLTPVFEAEEGTEPSPLPE